MNVPLSEPDPSPADGPAIAPGEARLAERVLAATNAALRGAARLAWSGDVPRSPRRVCVWRTGNIGDVVCALPALAALRVTWPEAHLTLLSSPGERGAPGARELLANAPWIDDLWIYHPREVSPRAFGRELAARGFDLVVRLPQNMSSPLRELRDLAFLRLVARVPHARGFAVGNLRWLGRGAGRALSASPDLDHESDRLRRILRGVAVDTSGAEFPIPIDARCREDAQRLLAESGAAPGPLLCIAPGAKRATNRWPIEHFAEVAGRWGASGRPVAVLGGAADAPLAARIAELSGHPVADLCGRGDLVLAAAVLERATALVTNDTGPMHLAAALGTPCVVAFSARDVPYRWYPYELVPARPRHHVLRRAPVCSPCWVETCPHANRCVTDITPEEVWRAVEQVAGAARRPLADAI